MLKTLRGSQRKAVHQDATLPVCPFSFCHTELVEVSLSFRAQRHLDLAPGDTSHQENQS